MVRQRRDRCSTQRVGRKSNFTIIFASTAASQLLRCVQAIWAGKTAECEPKRQVQEQYPEQFHFHTHNHWSTPTSKEALIDRLFQIHIAQFMLAWTTRATLVDSPASSSLQPHLPCRLLLLDVHSSNRDKDMFARLRLRYPILLILFVPANCTSLLQPLDVNFNGPIKRHIKALAAPWLAGLAEGHG